MFFHSLDEGVRSLDGGGLFRCLSAGEKFPFVVGGVIYRVKYFLPSFVYFLFLHLTWLACTLACMHACRRVDSDCWPLFFFGERSTRRVSSSACSCPDPAFCVFVDSPRMNVTDCSSTLKSAAATFYDDPSKSLSAHTTWRQVLLVAMFKPRSSLIYALCFC